MNNIIKDKNQILIDSEFIQMNIDKIKKLVSDWFEFNKAIEKLKNNTAVSIWSNFIN